MAKSRGRTTGIKINVAQVQQAIATQAQKDLRGIIGQATRNKVATEIFAEMCEPYVPIGSGEPPEYWERSGGEWTEPGRLRASVKVTEKMVTWGEGLPYAHYVYEGVVYGPNFPIIGFNWITGERIVKGFYSKKGELKQPTGAQMNYYEWKAERHWDEAMLRDNRRLYNLRVTKALQKIARKRGKI